MVNKCSIVGCYTNYAGHDKGTVFPLPQDSDQRRIWIKFLNRADHESLKKIFICYKHFAEDVLFKTKTRVKLISELKPVPTVIPHCQKIVNLPSAAIVDTIKTPRKPPTERIFQKDQLHKFVNEDSITCLEDLISKGPRSCEEGISFDQKENFLLMYKLEFDENTEVPQVTYCIRVEKALRVKLFYKNVPMPLPTWFRQNRNTVLTSCSMLQNLINHMKQTAEENFSIFSELQQLRYTKCPNYSSNVVRYALYLRYTSLQAYKLLLEEFPLPSVSYLRSLTNGMYSTNYFIFVNITISYYFY